MVAVSALPARPVQTILAVDDDPVILTSMSRVLGRERTVVTTTQPAEAIELARTMHPDLAIVDMRIGHESGIELIKALKAEWPNIVIALISGYLSVEATVIAVRAGADIIMSKPCTGKDIIRRVEEGMPTELDWDDTPSLARAQAEHIERVLKDCGGNISEAARRLGVHRSSLQRRMRKQKFEAD